MRPVLFLLLIAAAGCKHPGSPKLEGHWKGQRAEGVAPELQQNANTFATETEIVAKGNQIMISSPSGKNVQATYFVDKDDAQSLVIHTDKDYSSETFVFTDPKTMQWRVDERRSIVFKKVD